MVIEWRPAGTRPVLLSLAVLAFAAPLSAQAAPSAFCFRPGPPESCRSFLLFEARGQIPLLQTDRVAETYSSFEDAYYTQVRQELGGSVSWDFGYVVNLTDKWAFGATVAVDLQNDADQTAGALHLRRWFSDDIALDLAPGIIRRVDPREVNQTGYSLAARAHVWDVVFGLRYDALDVKGWVRTSDRIGGGGTITHTDPGGIEHMLSATLGFESVTGLLVSVVGIVLAASAFSGLT